jgi:hypothetical protein
LLWSVIPYPGSGYAPERIALWPLPVVYAVAPMPVTDGSSRVELRQIRLEPPALATVLSGVNYVQLYRNIKHDAPRQQVTAAQVRNDVSAVYFYENEADAARRADIMGARGNRLRRHSLLVAGVRPRTFLQEEGNQWCLPTSGRAQE